MGNLVGVGKYIPSIAMGHKVYPQHLAGMIGLPVVGDIFYVDGTSGSDDANDGSAEDQSKATVVAAEDLTTSANHDVVIVSPTGGSGRTAEASALVWDKRFTHLIGNAAPTMVNPRAGASLAGVASGASMTISNNGCIFKNITLGQFNDVNVMVNLTGNVNYFEGVHFAGIGNATAGDDTAARCLTLTGAEENLFVNCTFGLDTVTRSAANALVEQTGSCPRNEYVGCNFNTFNDSADALWFKADTGNCTERYLNFKGCFFNNPTGSSSTAMTIGMDLSATSNGWVNLLNCNYFGATDLANNYDMLYTNSPSVDTANQGLMVIQAT